MKTIAIINAAGKGVRFGDDLPKQYIEVKQRPILYYSLKVFERCASIDEIYIVCDVEYFDLVEKICTDNEITKFVKCIEGGATANLSRYHGLLNINAADDDLIVMHDAVRPLIKNITILKMINIATKYGCSVCGTTINANIYHNNECVNVIDGMPSNNIFVCAMPFVCRNDILKKSFDDAFNAGTLNNSAGPMGLVNEYGNIHSYQSVEITTIESLKITYRSDINLFEKMI
jgi:2-C-methyl-D-erythritol 4-phosphate cytidylyltransferase